jgi:hypothetical protein
MESYEKALDNLKKLVARCTTPSGMVQRAKIILACINGETVQSIVHPHIDREFKSCFANIGTGTC